MKKLEPQHWNHPCAAHLLARSGFGAPPDQISLAASRSLEDAVDALFQTPANITPPEWVTPEAAVKPDLQMLRALTDDERRRYRRKFQRETAQQQRELTGWWLERMISSPCPLQEKMTLFWHGHFATSIRKVRSAYMMYAQNQTLRRNAFGNWRQLITAVSQDPAMLVYLDNTRSRAGAPNENYARELMELFTLGEGRYTEDDIKEAARAFTGWMVHPKRYAFFNNVRNHDRKPKTFFGRTGNFTGHDIIRIILEQEKAAEFLVSRLWNFFAYENPSPDIVQELAAQFRDNDYELQPLLKSIFMSEAFYSPQAMHTQIKSPAQWLVGSCIALGIRKPDTSQSINALRSLGQELFAPPNVKGWDGGYAWITTSSLTSRYNLAKQLINQRKRLPPGEGKNDRRFGGYIVNTANVLPWDKRNSLEQARNHLELNVYQTVLSPADRSKIDGYFDHLNPVSDWTDSDVRNILHVLMSTPQYQLT
ncbi:DUF1800 domain-containing protein [Pontiella agarivorans]|uniref:DUF1800 domain-containing protein n=1 Tax=Pontiella agarivorans TaxID=3038953 RepID=A0ABU5MZY3_9BACT|nr:DUF1800 domain-containing protein [Pontiella agarivorans]MDZ8119752.1 DUF1800 domain-containing protein [Pontiella agarivorans]